MGLFDFFKKLIEPEVDEPEVEKEKIVFSEVGNWTERKSAEVELREKEIFDLVQEKIRIFAREISEKIDIVEKVDVELKKGDDKIKFIVNGGRKKYIEFVEDFIVKLENLKKEKLEKFIDNINKVFSDFHKSSHMSYERATILIGKEMADVKEILKVFSKDLIKIFDENKHVVNLSKTVSFIKLKLNHLDSKEIIGKDNETIISLDKKIKEISDEKDEILVKIEKIKKSEDYIKNLERQKQIKTFGEELEKDLLGLKQFIDFKALADFFHIFEEQMNIVKDHKENFQTSFRKDEGESIVRLLDESKLNNETISEKIRQINNKKEEIIKNEKKIKKDETEELYSKITNIILEIGSLNNEKIREEKVNEKLKTNREEAIIEIKDELEKEGLLLILNE